MIPNLLNPGANQGLGKSPSINDLVKATNTAALISEAIVAKNQNLMEQRYSFPSNIGKAKMHTRAAKFGYNPIQRGMKKTICPCCSLPVDTEDI